MALTIRTNLASLIAQQNLNLATVALNTSLERMSTGYRINKASDNAAGYSIATLWNTQLGSIDIASDNAAMGMDMLNTAEENYELITEHLQRIRNLTEQAANGTYGSSSLEAIRAEISARLDEIDRISGNAKFNGINLMDKNSNDIMLQVGIFQDDNSKIKLDSSMFDGANATYLLKVSGKTEFAESCTSGNTIANQLDVIDKALKEVASRGTQIGAAQNRVNSAESSLTIQYQNMTSSLSTIRDTDVAEESSRYVQEQILQQATATLLSTANQSPSIALNLI